MGNARLRDTKGRQAITRASGTGIAAQQPLQELLVLRPQ
jgi:hypothetical protein